MPAIARFIVFSSWLPAPHWPDMIFHFATILASIWEDSCVRVKETAVLLLAAACPQLVGADISPKSDNSRFDPQPT
jgi:hypothetical protein